METKVCVECNEDKPLNKYSDNRKKCNRCRSTKQYWSNPEKYKAKTQEYYQIHKEEIGEKKKNWTPEQKAKKAESDKRSYEKYKESRLAQQRKYQRIRRFDSEYREQQNAKARLRRQMPEYKEKEKLYHHEYNQRPEVKERKQERQRIWKANNREKVREYNRRRTAMRRGAKLGDIPDNLETFLKERQNGMCGICNTKILEADIVEIDHWIAVTKGGSHDVSNLRYTHRSCNRQKLNKLPEELGEIYPLS